MTIKAGDTVTWENKDSVNQVIASTSFATSPSIAQNGTFVKTFDAKETYDYYCSIHPSMTGKIIFE